MIYRDPAGEVDHDGFSLDDVNNTAPFFNVVVPSSCIIKVKGRVRRINMVRKQQIVNY